MSCPLCNGLHCRSQVDSTEKSCKSFYCNSYKRNFSFHSTLTDAQTDVQTKSACLVADFLLKHKDIILDGDEKQFVFYYENRSGDYGANWINIYNLLATYPKTFIDKANRALLNLSYLYPAYGNVFSSESYIDAALFDEECVASSYISGMFGMLCDLGYLNKLGSREYSITAEGWKKIDILRREENAFNQAFIAMSFGEYTRPIREAFRQAIEQSGYFVCVIDEKEHNNQIVPEIFFEIERSKFVVVDVTYPNYGAYYEAGYAQALGKQVIICCRRKEFDDKENPNRPHFDISQKSMVVWEDETDLVARLKKRIEATVK